MFTDEHRANLKKASIEFARKRKEREAQEGRVCSDCKKKKPIEEFTFMNRSTGRRKSICRECCSIRFARWSSKPESKEKQKATMRRHYTTEKNRVARSEYRKKMLLVWDEILERRGMNKCKECGYDKNKAALEFHHVNPGEKETVMSLVLQRPPTEKSIAELDKCICLCSNCHRELHHPLQGKV